MEGEQEIDIAKLIHELKNVVDIKDDLKEEKNTSRIIRILDSLVDASKNSDDFDFKIDNIFSNLLAHESNIIVAKAAKAIAEISKTEKGRITCTENILAKALINLLKGDDLDILTQTSRALGNICYDNEQGKKIVQDCGGLELILDVVKRGIDLKDKEGSELLRNVAAGCLLNYLVDQKNLKQNDVGKQVVPVICDILEIDGKTGKKAATHALLTLETLNDSGIEFLNERLTKILVEILANDTSTELSEICLELLHGQAENEKAQILLAKAGVCELLLNLLEKHVSRCEDEEARTVLKTACNLIVIIITGDESMNLLYDNSNGIVYKKLVSWLEGNCDEDLQMTAVLAMGNFARTDGHCQLMVAQGIHQLLLELLKQNNSSDGNIRLQHALLSAIRNLVIPKENKPIMLADGLIDVVYPMLQIPTFPVVFKLLGTLRIVIHGQEEAATLLGTKEDLLEKVMEWCNTEDHAGVQGEANRLLAWLVNNSRSKDVVSLIIKTKAIEHLVKMVTAVFPLMQNEALLSLAIISAMALSDCQEGLIEANIGQSLKQFFEKNACNLEAPIVKNAITFSNTMIKSDVLKVHLSKSGLSSSLTDFIDSLDETSDLKTKATELRDQLKLEINSLG